jgi:hypothetical protein
MAVRALGISLIAATVRAIVDFVSEFLRYREGEKAEKGGARGGREEMGES